MADWSKASIRGGIFREIIGRQEIYTTRFHDKGVCLYIAESGKPIQNFYFENEAAVIVAQGLLPPGYSIVKMTEPPSANNHTDLISTAAPHHEQDEP